MRYRVDLISWFLRAIHFEDNTVAVNSEQKTRYSRQMCLAGVGEHGQRRLLESQALIIGMGGLGSPAAMYLTAAGVGRLVISDFDRVDVSNLQRQIIHTERDIGDSKASSAKRTLQALNSAADITALDWALDDNELHRIVAESDVVLDCSDNFPTRFAVNEACVRTKTPLVSGAALRLEGQVLIYLPGLAGQPDSACYRCLYREAATSSATCSEAGVLAPLVGVIGALQAVAAMRILLDLGGTQSGGLLLYDALAMDWQSVVLPRDPSCPTCSHPQQ